MTNFSYFIIILRNNEVKHQVMQYLDQEDILESYYIRVVISRPLHKTKIYVVL